MRILRRRCLIASQIMTALGVFRRTGLRRPKKSKSQSEDKNIEWGYHINEKELGYLREGTFLDFRIWFVEFEGDIAGEVCG